MRFLKRFLPLAIGGITVLLTVRWAIARLRRIILRPTDDATPPIGPTEIVPQMRRIVVSDLHLGAGDRLDDFDADEELAAFIRSYVARTEPVELILAGDTFEFLQVRLPDIGDFDWSAEAAVHRLNVILQAHPEPITALREFVARPGNQLTLLIGNHDFELHYRSAKTRLREVLGVAESDAQLRFGLTYSGGGLYIDHGMQFDPWNRFVHVEGICEPFEVVRGTRMVKEVINPLEDNPLEAAPLIDNVKPVSAFFWYMLSLPRLRQPHVRRFVALGMLRLFRTNALPRLYYWKPEALERTHASSIKLPSIPLPTNQRPVVIKQISTLLSRLGLPSLLRALVRQPQQKRSDVALAQVQHEAKRELRREIREFKDAMISEIARIAARPEQQSTTLFVCGHTHGAQVVPLNEYQTYINTGTWTTIVLDIVSNRREEQRFPFLDVQYPDGDTPRGQLMVWHGKEANPPLWRDGDSSSIEHHPLAPGLRNASD
jgi:UDP-2,3-diacylglucosamine pyrophosphatase LpxH